VERVQLARESDRDRVRREVRRGELVRVRRGAYLEPSERSARELARLHVRAVARQLRAPVFSHDSAALEWGWPLWHLPSRSHVTQGTRRAGSASPDVVRHFAHLPDDDVAAHGGILLTTKERTLLDVVRVSHPLAGLVVADAALADGVDREAVLARAVALGAARGARVARCVLELADPGAESAWESWLRYVALRAGLPRPTTQWPVPTRLGTFRADLAWPEHGVLAEFDGQVKYRDGAFGAQYDGSRALLAEKRRTDAIAEATGLVPVRVTARDAPDEVAARLVARFPRSLRAALTRRPLLRDPRTA
jgi:hypothetical protein